MYISKVQVTNYKSYHESGEIELKPGFNIVVGQNSAGKTAVFEAMQGQFNANPHRSLKTVKTPGTVLSTPSSVLLTIVLTREELLFSLLSGHHLIAAPTEGFVIPEFGGFRAVVEAGQPFLTWLFNHPEFRITTRFHRGPGTADFSTEGDLSGFGLYPVPTPDQNGHVLFLNVHCDSNKAMRFNGFTRQNFAGDVVVNLASRLRNRIYRFWAERYNFGDAPVGTNTVLKANAANLPEVLDLLNGNTARMERFNRAVREILPQVRHVSVTKIPPSGTNPVAARVLVWPHDYQTEREDLANPLNECGSGIGQVLAILYVVMNSSEAQVILVDEPQSFLHPGAVRKLIEVLKGFPQHQYIFATHSPAVITAADPATLTIARAIDGESKLETIDPSSA